MGKLYEIRDGDYVSADSDTVIAAAKTIIKRQFRRGRHINSPADSVALLRSEIGGQEREIFAMVTLDNRHRVIAYHELFYGTIDSTTVYPREVVKAALYDNAAAVILAHNHPSGIAEPSEADSLITRRIQAALDLMDIRVLDHFVIGADTEVSLASRGLM